MWTLAAVDDVIARGRLGNRKELRQAAAAETRVRERMLRVCAAHLADPTEQLARPLPYDLDETSLTEYRRLDPKWQNWQRVSEACAAIAAQIFNRL